jgi:hypothetical protein
MWLWVDFNAVEGDTIWTSVRQTKGVSQDELMEGYRVGLRDHEGNSCWGTITGIEGPIVYLELDWSTWRPADEQEKVFSLTHGNPSTGSFLGISFEVTKIFRSPDVTFTNAKRTEVLQP